MDRKSLDTGVRVERAKAHRELLLIIPASRHFQSLGLAGRSVCGLKCGPIEAQACACVYHNCAVRPVRTLSWFLNMPPCMRMEIDPLIEPIRSASLQRPDSRCIFSQPLRLRCWPPQGILACIGAVLIVAFPRSDDHSRSSYGFPVGHCFGSIDGATRDV